MSVSELLREISALPQDERLHLVEQLVKLTEADIPQSFREGMTEAERGELLDFDKVLKELDRE